MMFLLLICITRDTSSAFMFHAARWGLHSAFEHEGLSQPRKIDGNPKTLSAP